MNDRIGNKLLPYLPKGAIVLEDEDFVYVVIDPNHNLDQKAFIASIETEGRKLGIEHVGQA